MNKKRGQVTIFVILGIFIFITVSLMLYIQRSSQEITTPREIARITDFDGQSDSYNEFVRDCFKALAWEAINNAGTDPKIIEQYLKVKGMYCFENDHFQDIDVILELPLTVDVSETTDDYVIKIDLKTTLTRGDNKKTIDDYKYTFSKAGFTLLENNQVTDDGNDFLILPPEDEQKQPYVEGEVIVQYNSDFFDEEEYQEKLISLYVTNREPFLEENIFDEPVDDEIKELLDELSSDEKITFDESKISYDDFRAELLALGFIDDISRNTMSYSDEVAYIIKSRNRREQQSFNINDQFYPYQWYLNNFGQLFGKVGADIDAEYAWKVTQGDEDIIIAVIDQGIFTNPDTSSNIITSKNYDFIDKDFDVTPSSTQEYHGTHVAGVIASKSDNRVAIAGVCPNCKLINMRIMDATSGADSKTLISAVIKSVINGADIVSMSLGSTYYSAYEESVFKKLSQKGIIFVAAAGNDGTNQKNYPAAYNDVIAVGATDNLDQRAYFSNYGNWVDVYAPGDMILSMCQPRLYCFSSGTSMATPLVSGVIGLMLSVDDIGPSDVKRILVETSDYVNAMRRINAGKAVNAVR